MISCGLKKLIEEYKKETGQDYDVLACHIYAARPEFLEWLAQRVESTNIIKGVESSDRKAE